MSAKAFHLNLLNPHERRSSSPVRAKILLPLIASICLVFMLGWVTFVSIQLAFVKASENAVTEQISELSAEHAVVAALKTRYRNLQAGVEQFAYYGNGRVARGELFKRLATAVPEGITLTSLSMPPPPDQHLRPPIGTQQPPLQGPTETSERAELRLVGLASAEQDVFQLMNALKGEDFTNLVVITERTANPADESPRVHAFRQGSPAAGTGAGVYFDIAYTLKPREFVK